MVLYFCKESQNYFNSFATLVPIGVLRWYRFMRYDGTVSPILSRSLDKIRCPLGFVWYALGIPLMK